MRLGYVYMYYLPSLRLMVFVQLVCDGAVPELLLLFLVYLRVGFMSQLQNVMNNASHLIVSLWQLCCAWTGRKIQ